MQCNVFNAEMRTLLDANFYSVLYYNSVIWLTPNLSPDLKQSLLSISACALRSCLIRGGLDVSFEKIHKDAKKCTPKQIMYFQIALKLHKLLNEHDNVLSFELVTVMDQIICTRRQLKFQIFKNSRSKIGMNTTANKLFHVSNLISLDMLNLNFVHFKKLAKILFLKNGKT